MTDEATLDFIRQHSREDVRQLALQSSKYPEVDMKYALDQIAGRQKAQTKLPSWAAMDGIVYPHHLSMEQCSSEATADYKAKIAGSGRRFVDLTAGLGVDTAFISRGFQEAVSIEQQQELCAISSHNYSLLGLHQIQVVCGDGVDYLHQMEPADLIYLDPARRDAHGGRTYGIADCTPNVLEIRDELLEKSERVMIKLSPMLDWQKAVADVGHVVEVHIVSVENECKELLLVLSKQALPLKVFCVNDDHIFTFEPSSANPLPPAPPQQAVYLYEPNASIMKAGCFDLVASRFQVSQLGANSHLFVSEEEVLDFPGRRFQIEQVTSMNKRELKSALASISKANIAVRNFPMSVAELRKRLKLQEGGDVYIFATTVVNKSHQLFVCRKKS